LFEEDEEGGLYACRFDATHTSHRAHRRACVTSHRPVPTADRRPRTAGITRTTSSGRGLGTSLTVCTTTSTTIKCRVGSTSAT
jgi:hypothetical protein